MKGVYISKWISYANQTKTRILQQPTEKVVTSFYRKQSHVMTEAFLNGFVYFLNLLTYVNDICDHLTSKEDRKIKIFGFWFLRRFRETHANGPKK